MTYETPNSGGDHPAPPHADDHHEAAGPSAARSLPHQSIDFAALRHLNIPQDAISDSLAAATQAISEHRAWQTPPLPVPAFTPPGLPHFDLGLSAATSQLDTDQLIGADALLNSPTLQHIKGLAVPEPSHWLPKLDVPTPGFMSAPRWLSGVAAFPMHEQLTRRNWATGHLDSAVAQHTHMARWLKVQVPRVDMSAYSDVICAGIAATAKFENLMTPAIERMTAQITPWLGAMPPVSELMSGLVMAPSLSSAITDLMCGWNVLSGLGHQLSNWALRMALRVRRELVTNPDRDAVRRMIVWFMHNVLGYVRVEFDDQIEAASSALLDDTWLPSHRPARDSNQPHPQPRRDLPRQLRALTNRERNLWRPIPTTTLGGQQVAELAAPITRRRGPSHDDDSRPMTEGDRITAPDFVPAQPPLSDPQLKRLLATFTPVEQEVVWKKYHDRMTWADAVTESGLPLGDSERIRRKFARARNIELRRRTA